MGKALSGELSCTGTGLVALACLYENIGSYFYHPDVIGDTVDITLKFYDKVFSCDRHGAVR